MLVVGLIFMWRLHNISDENVVEQLAENNYFQYFCGDKSFLAGDPREAMNWFIFANELQSLAWH